MRILSLLERVVRRIRIGCLRIEDAALIEMPTGTVLMVKVGGRWVEGTTEGPLGAWVSLNRDIVFKRRYPDA